MAITLYGAAYSTYLRTARLALEEKGQAYTLSEVDIFKPLPEEHLKRHPFGKIPVLDHDGFQLYETGAITRYVDEAFPGPSLQPGTPRERARMMQVMGVLDSYGYGPGVQQLFVQRAVQPALGGAADEAVISGALPAVRKVLGVLEGLRGAGPYMAGPTFSLADLHAIPIVTYLRMTPEGSEMLQGLPGLTAWWGQVSGRPSVAATRSPLEK